VKKNIVRWLFCFILIFSVQSAGWAASSSGFSISGVVKQPIRLNLEDLSKFQSLCVRLNEVDSAKNFRGVFNYQGVPLRTLLDLAHIQKEQSSFPKALDMGIIVRNKAGKQIVISWGEVFYKNPAEIIVAFSSSPVMPYRAEAYKKWSNLLNQPISFPKLVVANDFYSDRCLEDITAIEVIDLNPKFKIQKKDKLYSPSFSISGSVKNPLLVSDLSVFTRVEAMIKPVGDGKGYLGLKLIQGVPLTELLKKAGATMDVNTAYLVSAPDGYRTLLSFGELFLNPAGARILVADQADNQPMEKTGKFNLYLPDELSADRAVNAIANIEVINLKKTPQVYLISVGCADTSLLTLEAISYLNKSDIVVCSEDIAKRYAFYIGHRPVLFDPFKLPMPKSYMNKDESKMSHPEREKLKEKRNTEAVRIIRNELNKGKSVALLEYGDPAIYGSFRRMNASFADNEKRIIPGVSAFNAANSLIGKDMTCKGSIILSSPWSLKENPDLLKAVAEKGDTLAIFMGLRDMKELMPVLKMNYPASTPLTFAIRAGYSNSQRLIKTTVGQAIEAVEKENEENEQWLGMIYVGSCLE
jgi:precorrin-4 methylase